MNVYMSKNVLEYENPVLTKHIKNIITLIDFDSYLAHYQISIKEDFVIETIDDAWILFEFLAYLSEGINMQEYLGVKNIMVFKTILLCIQYEVDFSELLTTFRVDDEKFVKSYCMDIIESIYNMENGSDNDIVFEFCTASRVASLIGFARLFNDIDKDDGCKLLKTSSNIWFFSEIKQILDIEINALNDDISNGKMSGFAKLHNEFNRTMINIAIFDDHFMGICADYTENFCISFPVLTM